MILNNHYTHDPRVTEEAESLVKHGYTVKVIAWDRKREYPTYEVINGVEIVRIRVPWFLDRLLPFEILKVPVWQVMAYKKAKELYETQKFQVVHVHDWPDLPVGVKLKQKIQNIRLIYDSHEIWNYMVFTNKLPEWIWEVVWRERAMLKYVDALITVGSGYKKYFLRYKGIIKLVLNAKRRKFPWKAPKTKPLTIVYIGGFNDFRCINELIKSICNSKFQVSLIIAGPNQKEYVNLFKDSENCGVNYLGYIPKSKVIPTTLTSSLVYYVFKCSNPLYKIGMPNKLFEAIATGRASLAGKDTASGNFVEEYKIGLAVTCSEDEILNALMYLIENPKLVIKFGRRAYSIGRKYNWENESKKLLQIYEDLLVGGYTHG
nr:glycosyltransferase [Thermococcus sp. ES12]